VNTYNEYDFLKGEAEFWFDEEVKENLTKELEK
jgi:hypothetical protein